MCKEFFKKPHARVRKNEKPQGEIPSWPHKRIFLIRRFTKLNSKIDELKMRKYEISLSFYEVQEAGSLFRKTIWNIPLKIRLPGGPGGPGGPSKLPRGICFPSRDVVNPLSPLSPLSPCWRDNNNLQWTVTDIVSPPNIKISYTYQ